MINGKSIDRVHYLLMLQSLQRMRELDELDEWYVCEQGQLMTDFVDFEGVLPAPCDCIVSYTPIISWTNRQEFQWFARIKDEQSNKFVYFTQISC